MAAALAAATASIAAPLGPNDGSYVAKGSVSDSKGATGDFEVQALLKGGRFDGRARLTLGGVTIQAPLMNNRSKLADGRCTFYFEQLKNRVSLSGPCDSTSFAGKDGRFEAYVENGVRVGEIKGLSTVSASGVARAAADKP